MISFKQYLQEVKKVKFKIKKLPNESYFTKDIWGLFPPAKKGSKILGIFLFKKYNDYLKLEKKPTDKKWLKSFREDFYIFAKQYETQYGMTDSVVRDEISINIEDYLGIKTDRFFGE